MTNDSDGSYPEPSTSQQMNPRMNSRPVVHDVLNMSQEELNMLHNTAIYPRVKTEPQEYSNSDDCRLNAADMAEIVSIDR